MLSFVRRIVRRGLLPILLLSLASWPAVAVELRIGVQKYGTLVILQANQTLERRLKGQDVTVSWVQFPGGPQLLEAMAGGSLDFGISGEAPPIFAQAAHKPLVYVGVEGAAPKGEAILVLRDSPIKTLADLRGKKVALNKGSNVHYLLVRALASAGMTPADIQSAFLTPADARAAFEGGSVDAWAIWDPYLAAAEASVPTREIVNGEGLVANRQFFLATPGFAEQHPELVAALLDEIDKTDHWAVQHLPQAAAELSPITGVPTPILLTALQRLSFGTNPLSDDIVQYQQAMADSFHQLALIPNPISVKEIVWAPHS